MAKKREKTRRQQKKKPTAQHAITLQSQAFQNIRTPNSPNHRKKALFRNTNISKLLTGQKSGRKSRTAQNAIKLQKQAFQKIKTQNFAKCRKKAFFNTQIFSNWYMRTTLAQCEPQQPYFYKGNTLSKRFRGQVTRAQIQVCVSTKQSSWLREGGNLWLLAFFAVATFFIWNAYFYSAKRRGPEPPFRWTPNRPAFWRNAVPLAPVRCIYTYIYFFFFFFLGAGQVREQPLL